VDSTGTAPEAYFPGQTYTLKITNVQNATLKNIWGPGSKEYNLQFMDKVWKGMSQFGDTLEWRFPKGKADKPAAMISRYICGGYDEDGYNTYIHRLVVTKITDKEICIVGWIPPGKKQNLLARKMADRALQMPCLKNYQ